MFGIAADPNGVRARVDPALPRRARPRYQIRNLRLFALDVLLALSVTRSSTM